MLKRLLLALPGILFILVVGLVVTYFVLVWRYRLEKIHVDSGAISAVAGTYQASIVHEGRERRYFLHVPPAAARGAALPLVIALHGGGGTAERTDDLVRLAPVADRLGFLLAYPSGVGRSWNDGRPDVRSKARKANVDDVGFIEAMVDDVASRLSIDQKRVFAAGISNGAFMSDRLACEASDRIAAIALVVGTAPEGFEQTCRPGRPLAVIAFLGTADPLVPFEGGTVKAFPPFIKRGKVVSADVFARFWARFDGCDAQAAAADLPDVNKTDDSHVVRETYAGCEGNTAVIVYKVIGGGHTWPGGKQYLSPLLVGKTNRDVDASALIWQFFAAHPMP